MCPCVAASLDGWSEPSTTSPEKSHTTIASGSSSSYGTPLALTTISSSSGTRAERLPLVHATSPLRGSSACSAQTSRRRAATASVTDGRLLADAPQIVHDVVAAAAEMVVQRDVVVVEAVVELGAVLVGLVDVAADLAHRCRRGLDVLVRAGRDGGVHRRPERRPLIGVDQVQRLTDHVGVDLHDHRVLQEAAGDDHVAHLDPG